MGEVVDFESRRPQPFREGQARCLACGHQWHAVARVGVDALQCPGCDTIRGVFDGPMTMNSAYFVFTCGCENTFMRIFRHIGTGGIYVVCAACGTLMETDEVFPDD